MAQLDRFLNLLVSNKATALNLSEGEIATLTIRDSARPVMKQPLTSAQILNLVREIAPGNAPHALERTAEFVSSIRRPTALFEVSLTQADGKSRRALSRAPAQRPRPRFRSCGDDEPKQWPQD